MPTAVANTTNPSNTAKTKANGAAAPTNGVDTTAAAQPDTNGTSNGTQTNGASEDDNAWFQRTCADLSERKLADSGDPNSVMEAVVAKSSLLWDNKTVRAISDLATNDR